MWFLLLSAALAASPFEGENADVVAQGVVAVPPSAIVDWLLDVENYASLYTEECGREFVPGETSRGLGAQVEFVHLAGPWRRRLLTTISKVEAEQGVLEFDHGEGRSGFVLRFTAVPAGSGSDLRIHAYVADPVWPFRKAYFRKVQPAWQACEQHMLLRLVDAMGQEG